MLRSKEATVPGFMGNETDLLAMKCDFEPNPHLTKKLLVTVLGVVQRTATLEGNGHLKDVSGKCVRDRGDRGVKGVSPGAGFYHLGSHN